MATHHSSILILGSGPAGLTAAIYAARAGLKPTLVHGMQPGGQLTITTEVENYPGFADPIQGPWLMQQMEAQAKHVGTHLVQDHIAKVDTTVRPFRAEAESGDVYTADVLIICTGASAKWLGIPSEQKYSGYGVSACATCDGPFFKQKEVFVIGGGNSAVEEALFLSKLASKVHIVHRRDSFKSEKILQKRLFETANIQVHWDSVLEEIIGKDEPFLQVTGVKLKNVKTNEVTEHATEGVFIAIGHKPNTDMFKGQLKMDETGYILTTPGSTKTSVAGVFAAGDVQDSIYRQAVTAAGTGCMAALEADKYLAHIE